MGLMPDYFHMSQRYKKNLETVRWSTKMVRIALQSP